MTAALLTLALLASPSPRVTRLSAYIVSVNPRAKPYAAELARSILVESSRHGVPVSWLAAIAHTESHFTTGSKGTSGEHGIWQVMLHGSQKQAAWGFIRGHTGEFRAAGQYRSVEKWRALPKPVRVRLLNDIRIGAYIGAMEIAAHIRLCKRLGHRVQRGAFRRSGHYYHRHAIDRAGHYNSGWRWPRPAYVRNLRRRSRAVKRAMGK